MAPTSSLATNWMTSAPTIFPQVRRRVRRREVPDKIGEHAEEFAHEFGLCELFIDGAHVCRSCPDHFERFRVNAQLHVCDSLRLLTLRGLCTTQTHLLMSAQQSTGST